jgi:Ca2+/Na+ antiporter
MINHLILFIAAIVMVVKGATMATTCVAQLAESFHLSKYTVSFLIIAGISILPETFIVINASLEQVPEFGLGMLFGSNIADLTIIVALIIFLAGRGLQVESKILKHQASYPFLLLLRPPVPNNEKH